MNNARRYFLFIVMVLSLMVGIPLPAAQAQVSLPAEINKRFNPISISQGGISTLTVTVFNPNEFDLANASWTDNLAGVQPGIVIANPPNMTNACGGTVSANAGSTTLSLTGGSVPAQVGPTPGSCSVTVEVTSSTVGNLINTIPAGALTADGIPPSTTPASATLQVIASGTPTVSKGFNPNLVWVGQTSTLTIVINNPDANTTLTQASLTDTLPSGVTLVTPFTFSLTGCGPGTLTANGSTSVTLNNAQIAPSSSCTIRVDVVSNTRGSYLNTIPAGALSTQQGRTNPSSASARLRVQDLGVSKAFLPTSFAPGGTSTLTITLRNPTSTPYDQVSLTDTLPGTVLTIVPNSWSTTCGGTLSVTAPRTISLTGGTIPAGTIANPGTCTITVQVTAPPGSSTATYTNTIPANSVTTRQGATNLLAGSANVTIRGAEMTGAKSFSPATISPNGNSRLRIDVFAPGDTNLTNVSIVDPLPANVTISNSTPATMSGCGSPPAAILTAPTGGTSVSLTGGTILAGARCRIEVYVTSTTPGVYTNSIPPSNITNTQGRTLANNLTANLTVSSGTTLSIGLVKAFNPVQVFGGAASTMTVRLVNPNTVALSGIAFTDDMTLLGSGMIIATPANLNTGNCGGALAGSPGATSFSFSGGSLAAGASCELTLSVTMNVNGNRTNRIPAGAVTTTQGATNPDPAEASLTNLPGAVITKSFAPNPVRVGDSAILTITIRNTTNIPLTAMGLTDHLPLTPAPGLQVIAGTASNTCGGTLTATPGTNTVQLAGGALAGSASCTIQVSVTGAVPADYNNCIEPMDFSNNENAQITRTCAPLTVTNGATGGITKSLISTDAPHTNDPEVTIGEVAKYEVTVNIPPGTYNNAQLVDTLDRGLAFVSCDSIIGAGLTASAGSFGSICQNPTTSPPAPPEEIDRIVTFNFGTLTNAGTQAVPLTFTYNVIVLDIGTNVDGVSLLNSASFDSTELKLGPGRTTVTVREPKLTVQKTADNTFISNGSEATITLTVSQAANSHLDAFDVLLEDPLPTGLDYVANSLDCNSGAQDPVTCVVDTTDPTRPIIRATWDVFTLAGGTSVIRFRVSGNAALPANGSVTNIANLAWTSLPGNKLGPASFTPNEFAHERFFEPPSQVDIYGAASPFIFNPVGGQPPEEDRNPDEGHRRATLGAFLIPVTGFAPRVTTTLDGIRPAYATTDLTLDIPKLNQNIPIVGISMRRGTWNVDWLWNEAGWLEKTAYPTFPGNSVITGHDVTADGFPGPFARIKQLVPGDYIFIHLNGYRYTYKVVSTSLVAPDDISVLRHEEEPWLTLITCDNYDVKTQAYLHRVAVRSVLIDIDSE